MAFDPQRAMPYARELSFPRRVGTDGERRALSLIRSRLESFGYQVETQPFEASTGLELLLALGLMVLQVQALLLLWSWARPVNSAGLILGFVFLLTLALPAVLDGKLASSLVSLPHEPPPGFGPRVLRRLGRRYPTANLIARRPAPDGAELPNVILVAHWDSKSQALSLSVRTLLVFGAYTAAAVFAMVSVLRMAMPGAAPLAFVSGLAAVVLSLPVLLMYLVGSGNNSPGAVDNASGAGLLLHLAEHYRSAPANASLTFVFTGAEELGVQGAAAFVRASQADGSLLGAEVINLDGIGADGPVRCAARRHEPLAYRARIVAARLGIALGSVWLPGALLDHLPFEAAKANAISLVSTGRAARAAHTPADSAENLSQSGFSRAGQIVLGLVDFERD